MEEQQAAPALATAFPAPPPFWQSFTPENLERIAEFRASQNPINKTYDPATELPLRILDLPPELRCLQPPVQPPEGKYKCFGDFYNVYIIISICYSTVGCSTVLTIQLCSSRILYPPFEKWALSSYILRQIHQPTTAPKSIQIAHSF